jgi:hypothetical protein
LNGRVEGQDRTDVALLKPQEGVSGDVGANASLAEDVVEGLLIEALWK